MKKPQTPEQREVVAEIKKLEKEKEDTLRQIRYTANKKPKIDWLNRFDKDSLKRNHDKVDQLDQQIKDLWGKWRALGNAAN